MTDATRNPGIDEGAGVSTSHPDNFLHSLTCLTDGARVRYVRTWLLPIAPAEIVQVPLDGSAPRRTGILWRGTGGRIDVHPDGRRIAISPVGVKPETWVLPSIKK